MNPKSAIIVQTVLLVFVSICFAALLLSPHDNVFLVYLMLLPVSSLFSLASLIWGVWLVFASKKIRANQRLHQVLIILTIFCGLPFCSVSLAILAFFTGTMPHWLQNWMKDYGP